MPNQENVVRDIVVEHLGLPHRATYFVEHGQIHVKTGAKIFRLPVTQKPADEAVEALLIGLATDAMRERNQSNRWAKLLSSTSPEAHG